MDRLAQQHPDHPRSIGWIGTTALAMGGSNQSLFLIGALVAAQGSSAIPLLIVGLLMSWAAAPGWIELVLMWPKRVGGIAATCAEAFRPYSPVLANLTGVCYWWGWIPTCGLTAMLSASAIREWYLPGAPVPVLATAIVLVFCAVNLTGVRSAARLAVPIAAASALLALLSAVIPVVAGSVDWTRATSFHVEAPFPGLFGTLTSAMAGLYLIGFAAPAFEAATCAALPISFNLSARQVFTPGLVGRLEAILTETGADPSALRAEITESAIMEETEASVATLHDLRALGITLVLDDFGTGYSSLAYVRRFPIDVLKVDRSFVADLDSDDAEDAGAIVEAIVNMARGLRVGVVAEGIETEAHAERLRALGCTSGQGYLYARPMSPEQVPALRDRPLLARA